MSQSLAQIHVHIIFSTKAHRPFLVDEKLRGEMHAYLATIMKAYDSPASIIGGNQDHVHILCRLSKTKPLAKIIAEAKRNSSKWIKTKGSDFSSFQWQNGYGAFSVSFSRLREVYDYILNQKKHHEKMTFKEEYRAFLRRLNIDFDESHIWD